MDFMQVVLIALVLVGIWAVAEIAMTVRRARQSVDTLDKTVGEVNDAIAEARPVISKLDGVLDDLGPALSQVEPLLKQANVAVEALSADLIEVNGVLRDVSSVTGTVSTASGAVSGIADAASEKVQKFFAKKVRHADFPGRALVPSEDEASEPAGTIEVEDDVFDAPSAHYFTYDAASGDDCDEC